MTKVRNNRQPERRQWRVDKLKPHPRQQEFFDELPRVELEALASSMNENRLQFAIDVLPEGKMGLILRGRNRVAAAKLLGWTEIDAVVRNDLVGQPDHVLIAFMIDDNMQRQQLGPLAIARCY